MKEVVWLIAAVSSAAVFVVYPAEAAAESGEAVAVIQRASALNEAGRRMLQPGAPVSVGERVDIDSGGLA